MPDAADLRAAALSDRKHRPATTDGSAPGLLHMLLPDVPGEPYGGYATPAQARATAEAVSHPLPLPDDLFRPALLRDYLRRWAASQPAPRCTATRTEQVDHAPIVRRCTREDTPTAHADGYHQWMRPGHAVRWPTAATGSDNAAGLRTSLARFQTLDDNERPL